ncbi:rhomboid-like protein [Nocardia stercoris]|uniref:Rhomboid family intramembrane serine protease n=1 Tax=Nocardia stercoris TaxID=2483361 RepID=A0A3M2L579_9NOCA|nr:rhomboid-like protein [Nocardia stercoris]RMI32544.1 hypothetical protein EBN03_11165 [Nocardia stercoris]
MTIFGGTRRGSGVVPSARAGGRRWLPVTVGYTAALALVSALWAGADPDIQLRTIADTSTNLDNLAHHRFGTLLTSAFVIADNGTALLAVPLLAGLLALSERRFGSRATVSVFLTGHVGATLLVAAGLWSGVRRGWFDADVCYAVDVGVSYGAMAVFGAVAAVVPAVWRAPWTVAWLAVALEGVVRGGDFTNVGHLLSYLLGSVAGLVLARNSPAARSPSWLDLQLLACGAFLASAFLPA